MSPDTHPEIHHRLDRMEASLSGSLEKLTAAVEKLVVLETKHHETITTLARYGTKLDRHDSRLDDIEKKTPLYDQVVKDKEATTTLIRRSTIGTVISLIVVGIAGLVWTAIVNQ